jgi:hypothetical protein
MPCILKMEVAGCSKILVPIYSETTYCHFSDDCNLYKFVNEVFKCYHIILQ